ncbi:YwaF family protein [Winogradskyella helgolandensis]|uniref:YwaF family protein n=1 Tax=Winogradskyella helgolandensis TaxID=2697010 RepID=UPI0015BF357A|nr:TIGR02206 family membrane protein [Winogradskyella helgolandensis]
MGLLTLFIVLSKVTIGSIQHVLPILLALGFGIILIKYSKRNLSNSHQEYILLALGWLVSIVVISYHTYRMLFDNYNFKTDLPLFLCSLIALLIPVFTHYRKYWMFEILVFWIIGGTLQGVITPDILEGFPSFDYFRYWVVHLGLLTIIFYVVFVFKMKPTLRSVFKSLLAFQVYLIVVTGLNYVLDANYFYLVEKPKSATLMDYFGEWPYYVIVGQLVLIPLFLLVYLPFYISSKFENSLSK